MIHPSAIVLGDVEEGAEIGAYAVIERGARIGRGTKVGHHAIVGAAARVGEGNEIFPFAAIGLRAQHRSFASEGALVIGAGNVFREHATVHAGTERATVIGDHNLFMVGAHVAHDAAVGSRCTIANGAQLAGHVTLEDHVVMGGLAGLAQHVRVGEGAFVAAGAMVERDLPPFVIAQGDRARVRALNVVGLRRMGVPEASVRELRRVFRALFVSKRRTSSEDPWASRLIAACACRW